jgi:NAD(P)-dependent dehydrogenase (short-subunit alcohol dehydrogenase family)
MDLTHAVALVTGANRGFGRSLAAQLVDRGAKVYAAARHPETVDLPGVVPLRLDITDPAQIAAAVAAAPDVTLLVNNAGVSPGADLLTGADAEIRREMDVHYFGTLGLTRAFVPVIERNGGGAILNVLSVLSWFHPPVAGAYSSAKAAGWAMSNALRTSLTGRGITVTALHVGYMDTDMASQVPADQKSDPALIAGLALDGVAAGAPEVIADDLTRGVKQGLAA